MSPVIPNTLNPRRNACKFASHLKITSSIISCCKNASLLDLLTVSKTLHLELFKMVILDGLSNRASISSSVLALSNCKDK